MNYSYVILVYNVNYFTFTSHSKNYYYANRKINSREKFGANYRSNYISTKEV